MLQRIRFLNTHRKTPAIQLRIECNRSRKSYDLSNNKHESSQTASFRIDSPKVTTSEAIEMVTKFMNGDWEGANIINEDPFKFELEKDQKNKTKYQTFYKCKNVKQNDPIFDLRKATRSKRKTQAGFGLQKISG